MFDETKGDNDDDNSVQITIVSPLNEEYKFKVRKTAKMHKVFRIFNKKLGIDPDNGIYRFFYNGNRIQDDMTPMDLDLKDGSRIEAFNRQTSGFIE